MAAISGAHRGPASPAGGIRARRTRPAPQPALAPDAAAHATLTIWIVLAALAVARAAFAFAPSTWFWGLDAQRFLAPLPGWTLWALGALPLLPALSRPLAPWVERLGDAVGRAPVARTLVWAAAGTLVTWAMPDRLHFVGDFQLRLTALESEVVSIAKWSHVALPLDMLLHDRLVRLFHAALGLAWIDATRLLGTLEAAVLGALAAQFARVLGLRGAAAFAASAIVLFGGYLTLFTGFDKAFMETCLMTAAVGVFGLTLVREGRGGWPLGLAAAAAFASHRSALALLVPLIAAWLMAWRQPGRPPWWRRPASVAALALPFVALAAMVPGILAAMRQWDRPVFSPTGGGAAILAAAFEPRRLLDLMNLVVQLAPLAIALPALLLVGRAWKSRESLYLLAILLPNFGLMLSVHARQGMFRDLDCFAAAGMALAMLTASLVGRAIEAAPARGWIAVAVALGVAAPAVQWLLLPTDLERGFQRAHAFVSEPPRRGDGERAETWDFLGLRYLYLERWAEARNAFEHAAETAPSPRILKQWAICAEHLGDYPTSLALYRRVVAVNPGDAYSWRGVLGAAYQLKQLELAKASARTLLTLVPRDPDALHILDVIARFERMQGEPPR